MVRRATKTIYAPHPRLNEVRELAKTNADRIIEKMFKVTDEASGLPVPFIMRWGQRNAYNIFQEERKKNIPVRLWFLKSRRVGLTSLFAALGLLDAWAHTNRRIGIIAHNEFRAKGILAMCKGFDKHMPENMRVPLSRDAIQGLKYRDWDSEIIIGTCNEPTKVRGDGLQWIHLSEPAHYDRMFHTTVLETATTIAPEPGTVCVFETTGKGRGSAAHQHWQAAKAHQNIYRAEFLPWQDDPTCAIPFEDERHQRIILDEIQDIEPRLMEKFRFYNLLPEQMFWGYFKGYIHRCAQDYEYFCREFPFDEEEAWDSYGISFFGDNEIAAMSKRLEEPYYFNFSNTFINQIFGSFEQLHHCKKEPPESDQGSMLIKLWRLPQADRQYVIGADCSLGERGGTFTAGYVIDMETREMMCSYRGRVRPDEHAYIMASLGTIYNTAILAPEVNPGGGGIQIMNDLQRLCYPRIYIYRHREDKRGIVMSRLLGWQTNIRTRPIMLNELRKMFIDAAYGRFPDPGLFRDKKLIQEMRTFQRDPETGRIEATTDSFDDTIIGLAIAHQVASDEAYGGALDVYGTYGKGPDAITPFGNLLKHFENIQDGGDPCDAISLLTDRGFDIKDGHSVWHPET